MAPNPEELQLFDDIRVRCNGMLPTHTYRAIYEAILHGPDGNIVEVGTAHAAATVSMAKAIQAKNRLDRIFTFERAEGGSRSIYGGVDENEAIIERNLSHFGVSDIVQPIIGDVAITGREIETGDLAALMLDCDGSIDRDFELFYNKLIPGGLVIIDDCSNIGNISIQRDLSIKIDLKNKLTFLLADLFVRSGLLETVGRRPERPETVVFKKPRTVGRINFSELNVLSAYRGIVFSEAQYKLPWLLYHSLADTPRLDSAKKIVRKVLGRG